MVEFGKGGGDDASSEELVLRKGSRYWQRINSDHQCARRSSQAVCEARLLDVDQGWDGTQFKEGIDLVTEKGFTNR